MYRQIVRDELAKIIPLASRQQIATTTKSVRHDEAWRLDRNDLLQPVLVIDDPGRIFEQVAVVVNQT